MILHTFIARWKQEATQADKDRALDEIRALQGQIPGLLETVAGVNVSPRAAGYELGAVMKFTDRAAADGYIEHPVHQRLLEWLIPMIEAVELELEV